MKTIEEKAEDFADSKERRGCSYYNGLRDGFIEGYKEAMRWRDPKKEFPPIDKIKYPNGNYSTDVLGEDFEGNNIIVYYDHDEKKWYFTMEGEDYTIRIVKWRPIE